METNPKKRVLVVDDDDNLRNVLLDALNASGFESTGAANGEEGLKMALESHPDAIMLDVMMPKMDGLTACHMIKNDPATKMIPVIMVTAIGFELNVKLSQQMGASGYVTKPFSSEDLLDKIAQVLTAV